MVSDVSDRKRAPINLAQRENDFEMYNMKKGCRDEVSSSERMQQTMFLVFVTPQGKRRCMAVPRVIKSQKVPRGSCTRVLPAKR